MVEVKSPEVPIVKEIPTMIAPDNAECPNNADYPEEKIVEEHNPNYVPLYFSAIVFALIILSYIYCAMTGLEVNLYREIGAISISGIITAACWYLNK